MSQPHRQTNSNYIMIDKTVFFFRRNGGYPPNYRFYGGGRGRPLQQNEVFDFLDSRFIDVFPENEFNEFLDEIEVEANYRFL